MVFQKLLALSFCYLFDLLYLIVFGRSEDLFTYAENKFLIVLTFNRVHVPEYGSGSHIGMLVHHPGGILFQFMAQLDDSSVYYSITFNVYYLAVNIHFLFLAKIFAPLVVKLHGLKEALVILAFIRWSLRGSLG